MARVKQVKAAKDYPKFGIKKGDLHYYTKIKTGPRSSREIRQIEPIKPQQLTSSAFKSALLDWEETKGSVSSPEDVSGLASTIREMGEEEQSKLDNMPEGLQQGNTGELLRERAEACETAADELDTIASEWEDALNEHTEATEKYEAYQDYLRRKDEGDLSEDEEEPEECEEPEEFDQSEYEDRVSDVEVSA